MGLYAIGLNHRTAPVEVRERVAFAADEEREALHGLREVTGAEEVVLLSTCNRTETYLRAGSPAAAGRAASWLRRRAPGGGPDIAAHLYELTGDEVARHAFQVAAGLDSMVLGEPQILGQVKRAVRVAADAGTLGGALDRLFQQAFSIAKDVRARTAIGELSVSAAATAVVLCRQIFGDLGRLKVLFVGAGEMIEKSAAHFMAHAPAEAAVANRTLERGQALAQRFGMRALRLEETAAVLHRFDIVVSCTASTLPIIGKGLVERALRERRQRPMFLLDLAVPRDIEPEVAELPDVFLHTLDSIGAMARENSRRRQVEVARAGAIVEEGVVAFADWLRARAAVPLIRRIRGHADHQREIELARASKRLARGDDPAEVIAALAESLTRKLLHPAMHTINRAPADERAALVKCFEALYLEPAAAAPATPARLPKAAAKIEATR